MSPELATRTTDPGTPLDDLLAELALAEKWPTPEGYCNRCGLAPCHAKSGDDPTVEDDGTCNYALAEPLTLDTWLNLAAADAVYAVFRHIDPWGARRETRSALAGQLGEHIADMYGRR